MGLLVPTIINIPRFRRSPKCQQILKKLVFLPPDTPLFELYQNGTLMESKHLATHLSDALRLAYLFKVRCTVQVGQFLKEQE